MQKEPIELCMLFKNFNIFVGQWSRKQKKRQKRKRAQLRAQLRAHIECGQQNKIGFNNCEKGRKDIKKNMKYKIHYYITLIVLCMMMLQNVVYAETTVFQIENQKGKKNETVTVPIEIHSGEEVGGFELSVYYNKEALEFVGLNNG